MEPHITLGDTDAYYRSGRVRLALSDERKHVLISGRSGAGKSTLLANWVAQKFNCGQAVALFDPHGDLALQVIDLVPAWRIRKTIYLNPADTEHPVAFNPLYNVAQADRPTRAAEIVAAFHSIWHASWGPRMEHILYNTVAALLENQGTTLLGIQRMLLDDTYRSQIVRNVKDPLVAQFWNREFPRLEEKFGAEATSPVLNKIGQLFSSPVIRNILGQVKSSFDPRHLIDNNYIFVANLSKGRLGEQHAALLGALLISSFGSAAMSRADMLEADRKDISLIIDEFANYTTTAFASLLSEARKYRLSLVLAHQYLDQMTPEIRSAVLGNVGSIIAFRIGPEDVETFRRQFADLSNSMLTELPMHTAWCRLLQYGETYDPIRLKTKPAPPSKHSQAKVIRTSRRSFGRSRRAIEEKIARFLTTQKRSAIPDITTNLEW